MSRLYRTLRWLHRWVGLTVGLIFALVSLSGSLLYFQPQFFRWAHGDLFPADLASRPVGSIERWVANANAAVPRLQGPIAVWTPHVDHNVTDAGMLIYGGQPPGGLGNMGFVAVLVAPDTGQVLGLVDVDRSPAWAPLFLHRDLWTGAWGRAVSGVMAIGSLFLIVAGLYLWWPPRGRLLRKKLSPRPWWKLTQAAPLHDWIGVWTCVLLVILAGTGLYLVQPTWVAPALALLPEAPEAHAANGAVQEAGASVASSAHASGARPCAGPIGLDAAIAAARQAAPEAGAVLALAPHNAEQTIWEIGFAGGASTAPQRQTHVEVDLACGRADVEFGPGHRAARSLATSWMAGLHDGTAFGPAGEAIVSLAGLAPVALAWSGVLMWLRKRRRGATASAAAAASGRVPAARRPGDSTTPVAAARTRME